MINLSNKISNLIEQARLQIVRNVNHIMVCTYYEVGKLIVQTIQEGEKRAEYGKNILKEVSLDLTSLYGKGFSVDNLENMRNFYLLYNYKFENSETLSRISEFQNSETVSRNYIKDSNSYLSWSHYLILMRIADIKERNFYEIESSQNQWSVRELKRQFNSGLFERLALSRNKDKLESLSNNGLIIESPEDLIKEPLILEFLGLSEKAAYSESDLETAIINEIEKFMLELGKGFFFGGRQVRFSFDEDHYFVDLVFYNRLLHCFVLIDLKIGKLKHQDIGQMQMYVNYYDRYVKLPDENPTVGIIICKDKSEAMVEITLPQNCNQIFAQKYQTVLPSKEQLKHLIDNN